jgi:hypothetical protein
MMSNSYLGGTNATTLNAAMTKVNDYITNKNYGKGFFVAKNFNFFNVSALCSYMSWHEASIIVKSIASLNSLNNMFKVVENNDDIDNDVRVFLVRNWLGHGNGYSLQETAANKNLICM